MTSFQSKLLAYVSSSPGIADRPLAQLIFGDHGDKSRLNAEIVRVNSEAHLLKSRGQLMRRQKEDGLIGNFPQIPEKIYFCTKCSQWIQPVSLSW